jgi:thermitase
VIPHHSNRITRFGELQRLRIACSLGRSLTARKLIAVGVLALMLPATADAAGYGTRDQRFVPGEALVRYEPGTDASERRELRSDAGVEFESAVAVPRVQLVSFEGSVRAAVARLEDEPGVAYAQPNYRYHALAAAPNDTHFGHLWGLGATPGVDVLPAWDRSRGAGQVIAVVDTGVDLTHPDLAGNLWTGPGGVHGHDFVTGDNDPDDYNMHGTHVAGTAAAIADNGQGVAGVAPQAQIMAVRVLDGDGTGSTLDIANGIAFAANNGAGVINLSLGGSGGGGDLAMQNAIALAEQRNAVVVAAAGNGGNDGVGDNNDTVPFTPCTLPNGNLICVAAVTKTGDRSDFSNFGPSSVDLGAPGGDGSGNPDGDVLSAKPSWGAPLFSEDFQTGSDGWAASHVSGLDWGLAGSGLDGESVTDSPSANYQPGTNSTFERTSDVSLAGQAGCRIDFWLRLANVAGPDFVGVGVTTGSDLAGLDFSGNTGSAFQRMELSISNLDGSPDARPTFIFGSNNDGVQGDGAYVDDFSLLCRAHAYDDTIAQDDAVSGGSYTAIAGTSMAAPHVAGVAALVRAVDPGAPPSQVVQALRNSAKLAAGMAGVTVTGGVADAVGAMDAALALPNPPPPVPAPAAAPAQPQPPARPRVSNVRWGARRGVLSMLVRGGPDVTGTATLKANITAARVRVVGRKAFAIGATRRTTVRIKLRKLALRQLRRKRRLRLNTRVVVRNSIGLRAATSSTITLRVRRR